MSFIYIASPYSHPDRNARHDRFLLAEQYAAILISDSQACFSPIVHCHAMAERYNMPQASEFWRNYNYKMISACSEIHFLLIDGWETSAGLKDELRYAIKNSIDRRFKSHKDEFTETTNPFN